MKVNFENVFNDMNENKIINFKLLFI